MESAESQLDHIRPFALDYVGGVIWITAIIALFGSLETVAVEIKRLDSFLGRLPNIHIPELVVGLSVVILGVILPYSFSVTFRPLTNLLLNAMLSIQRRLSGSAKRGEAWSRGHESIQRSTGLSLRISPKFCLLALESVRPISARNLQNFYKEISFRARATLPVAILLASAAGFILRSYMPPSISNALSIAVGVAFFAAGAWSTNQDLEEFHDNVGACLLLFLPNPQKREEPALGVDPATPVAKEEAPATIAVEG